VPQLRLHYNGPFYQNLYFFICKKLTEKAKSQTEHILTCIFQNTWMKSELKTICILSSSDLNIYASLANSDLIHCCPDGSAYLTGTHSTWKVILHQ